MKIKNKSIVVFEHSHVPKSGFDTSDTQYKQPFADFIESLGYEVEPLKKFLDEININGESFHIELKNASYTSHNAFTREYAVRKDANRFISLLSGHNGATILKIHFNKEYEADKLREKINKEIQRRKEVDDFIKNRDNLDEKNTTEIAKAYMNEQFFSEIVKSINISTGKITFYTDLFGISFDINGKMIEHTLYRKESTESNLNELFQMVKNVEDHTNKLIQIGSKFTFNEEVKKWITEQYGKTYYVKENKYSRH